MRLSLIFAWLVLALVSGYVQAQTLETAGEPLDLIPWASSVAPKDVDSAEQPAWQRYAVAAPGALEGAPVIALVIDDMGEAREWSARAVALPGPLTLSYFPHAPDLAAQTDAARAAGHELMLHMPMEPEDANEDPGPDPLLVDLNADELERRINAMLDSYQGYVGVNNHMGSRFSTDAAGMAMVLSQVRERGLLFIDSRTTAGSVGETIARDLGVPTTRRDIFIDNDSAPDKIIAQLAQVEALARTHGFAVAIAHPRPATLDVLETWLPEALKRGVILAPISAIIKRGHHQNFAAAENDTN